MPSAVIPQSKVEQLARRGLGNTEIADVLLREDHIDVTPAAISMIRTRRGLPALHNRYADLLPWIVRPQHASLYLAKQLRALGRRRAGEALPELADKRLDRFLQRLSDEDAVVHYEPTTPQGWFLVPRRSGVDQDVIRDPRIGDDGKPIR